MARNAIRESASDDGPDAGLGAAAAYWHALMERVRADVPGVEIAWKTYAGKTGRQCVIRGKDRNIAYLKPGTGEFLVSVALSDAAVAKLESTGLARAIVAEVRGAARYREGTPARVRVDSAKTLQAALTLLALKVADGGGGPSRRRRA